MSRHRAERAVRTDGISVFYRPRHCAAVTCLHNHADDERPPMNVIRPDAAYAAERFERETYRRPWERATS